MTLHSKVLLAAASIFVGLASLIIFQIADSGKFRLIACDVGQGDGMLLITPGGSQIVVDGGPGTRISDCLGRHVPLWDRTIEMMVLTHPHAEHMEGFLDILNRYQVKNILDTEAVNDTQLYREWKSAIAKEGAVIRFPVAGEAFALGNVTFEVLWPPKDKADIWKLSPPADLNDTSIVMRVTYGGLCAYLTGDLPKEILAKIIDRKCQVLKVVHHGSRTGTDEQVLSLIDPEVAVIQSGAKNQYGHPHQEVLDDLLGAGVKVLRNDLNGEVEIYYDKGELLFRSQK